MRIAAASLVAVLALGVGVGVAGLTQTPADRERARLQNRLGWEEMGTEAWAEAARFFQQAIGIDRTFEYAHYGLGRANMAMKKYTQAIAALTTCRDLYRAQAGRRFTDAQEAQRDRNNRLTEIDEQIRQMQTGRQTLQAQQQLRQLQNHRRDTQEAIQRGSIVALEVKVPAYVSLSLGSAYFRAGRLADAEREYKATIAADPKSGEAYNNLAVVFLETGRYQEAAVAVKAAKNTGFSVHPQLEQDIKDRNKGGS